MLARVIKTKNVNSLALINVFSVALHMSIYEYTEKGDHKNVSSNPEQILVRMNGISAL